MEEYLFVNKVLQAVHMTTIQQKPKYLKRYVSQTSRTMRGNESRETCIGIDNIYNPKQSTFFNTSKQLRVLSSCQKTRKRPETQVVLEPYEFPAQSQITTLKVDETFKKHFSKKIEKPGVINKIKARENRLLKISKENDALFYDVGFDQVKKRQKKCIIFPQSLSSVRVNSCEQQKNNKKPELSIDIKQLIKNEYRQQRMKRKINSKKGFKTMHPRIKTCCQRMFEQIDDIKISKYKLKTKFYENKLTKPLPQNQIRSKAVGIMQLM